MMTILAKDVKLNVRIGNTLGEEISTNICILQGECLSPILFIVYLAEDAKTN